MELDALFEESCARDWETVDPMEAEPVRMAVVGVGWFTRERALPALETSDRCAPTVAVSSTTEKASRVADAMEGGVRGVSYDEFHEGAAREEYDAVYVCTPNALHREYVETAASFGKHVLCEKPMERDSARGRELVELCEAAGVELMIAYRMQTEPAVRRARELIQAGYVGHPMEVRGDMSQRLLERVNPDPNQWRLDEEMAGGGALFDIGIYPLNTARFLLGADPMAVVGRTSSSHEAFDDVDETVSFNVEFPDGVYASCYASHNARQSSGITVTGTEGQVRVEPAFFQDQARRLHLSRGDSWSSITLTEVDQMLEEFDYFADRVRGDASIHPDGEHGLVDMRTMETVYESAGSGEWVAVE
jgi:xylose dehydrogenase (NAD/NADP)